MQPRERTECGNAGERGRAQEGAGEHRKLRKSGFYWPGREQVYQCRVKQSAMPTSPSSTVQACEHCRPRSRPMPVFEQLDSAAARTTPPEGSNFKAGPTHAKSESSPASVANICACIHSGDAASMQTPAASRKSHHIPSISHKRLQPIR